MSAEDQIVRQVLRQLADKMEPFVRKEAAAWLKANPIPDGDTVVLKDLNINITGCDIELRLTK